MPFFGHLPELIIILVLGLLIFGPKRLPEMGNAVGKTIKAFQKTMHEIGDSPDKVKQLDAPHETHETSREETPSKTP